MRLPVRGFDFFVRSLTGLDMVELNAHPDRDGARGTLEIARRAAVDGDGKPRWPTMADVEAAPWPEIKAASEAALVASGLLDAEAQAGN